MNERKLITNTEDQNKCAEEYTSYVVKAGAVGPQDGQDMFRILAACDKDFYPPLSARSSSRQLSWDSLADTSDGVRSYYEVLLSQETLFWKVGEETAGFLSFVPYYSCEHLKEYDEVCYLTTLCVLPKFRGMGLSTRIYAAVFDYIHQTYPNSTIAFRTWSTNEAQMYLVKKLGLTEILRLPDDRGSGVDTIYYVLREKK